MEVQTGVIAYRSPTGEFIDDEPIFEDFNDAEDTVNVQNPLDAFVDYIVSHGLCLSD